MISAKMQLAMNLICANLHNEILKQALSLNL